MVQKYINKTLNISVSDKEIENYYNQNKAQFSVPKQVNASHILVNTTEKAQEVLEQLKNRSFSEVAKQYSIGPSAPQGGHLGLFSRNQMVQNFSDVAFSLEAEEISNIVKTSYGYHIIKVHHKKDARTQTLNESREQIKTVLQQQKQQSALQLLLQQLTQNADIQKFI